MDYYLTEHARDAVNKRQIPLAWMERALDAPGWSERDPINEDLEHRFVIVPEFGNRVLRVIVNIKATPPRIVTLYFDRRKKNP